SWRADGQLASAIRSFGSLSTHCYLIAPDAEPERVLPEARRVQMVRWTASGALLAITDYQRDFLGVAELDPARPLRPARWLQSPEADIDALIPNHAGTAAVIDVNRGAYSDLLVIDLRTGAVQQRFEQLPRGLLYSD